MDELRLRPLRPADGPGFAAWGLDRRFCEVAGWRLDRSLAGHEAHWRWVIAEPKADHLRLAAVLGEEVVGYVDFAGSEVGWRELGYVVGPSARWGRGVGGAVARAGVEYGFGVLALREIRAEALDANVASVRILQSLGMTETGRGEDDSFLGEPSFYRRFRLSKASADGTYARVHKLAGGV
ncbi:GNAT family N-acetyltransferase [Kribbella sp. NBC_00382]|uniref:GNAT family N-acetyltransferase n=1 Tax=Kribbella sp. NBC_00382 TaxID=2975967 RepID=UPI002E24B84F